MARPGFAEPMRGVETGELRTVVCWRPTASVAGSGKGLTALFEDLAGRGVNLVSSQGRDRPLDPGRPPMANVLASVAAYETEVRHERTLAGQAAARAKGKTWGGSKPGRRFKVTLEQEDQVVKLKAERCKVAAIARAVGLSRDTVYEILKKREGAA